MATASPQDVAGMFWLFNKLRAMVMTVWFLLSAMSFYCGVYGAVR